jgi:trimeric autotransporter adhesin
MQIPTKRGVVMQGNRLPIFLLACSMLAWSQQNPSSAGTAASSTNGHPHLVKFSGTLTGTGGTPLNGVVGATFALYSEQTGGSPLWLETQNVQADKNGHYTVWVGSTKSDGLPISLFVSEQAQWLGVQPSGQNEQPRVLLLSVPYALKAADAETLGGIPASAFVRSGSSVTDSSSRPDVAHPSANSASWSARTQKNGAVPPDGPTDFTGTTGAPNPIVRISQDGTGPGLTVMAPKNDAIIGQTEDTTAHAAGVWGKSTKSTTGIGVYGQSIASDGGDGVQGVTASKGGNTSAGVAGIATASGGSANGVYGLTSASGGAGGFFENTSTSTGAKILIAEDVSGTQRLSVDTQGNVNVVTGTTTQVKGPLVPVNHARKVVTIQQNQDYFVTLDWSFPFPDTNYTVACSPLASSGFQGEGQGVYTFQVTSIASTSFQLEVAAVGTGDVTVHCIGVHD